jgi:uncharacterized protein with NRDE domain
MCTILILYQKHPQYPLLIAANRDEYYARPATTPLILQQTPKIVGGQDQEKGGTWMAVSADGRFAGLTNQRTGSMPDKNRKSRGAVVMSALQAASLPEAKEHIAALAPKEYNPFNLLFGDAENLYVAYCHQGSLRVEVEEIKPGFWVLPNDVVDSPKFNKVTRAKALLQSKLSAPWELLQPSLRHALADHEIDPEKEVFVPKGSLFPVLFWRRLEPLCIHTPVYGTRSSTMIAASKGKIEHYLFASGAPCKTEFVEYTGLLG